MFSKPELRKIRQTNKLKRPLERQRKRQTDLIKTVTMLTFGQVRYVNVQIMTPFASLPSHRTADLVIVEMGRPGSVGALPRGSSHVNEDGRPMLEISIDPNDYF